jgi:drug/metabolite transporter (DMT)-like permease
MNDHYFNLDRPKEKYTGSSRKISGSSRRTGSDFSEFSSYDFTEKSKLKFVKLLKPLYLFVMSVFFISLMNICTKILFELYRNIGVHTINFFKGFYIILLSMLFMKLDRIDLGIVKNFDKSVFETGILRVLLVTTVYIFSILSLKYTKLSNFLSINLIIPLLILVFQKTMEKEKFSKKDGKCLLMVLFAVLLITTENILSQNFYFCGVFYGLIASVLFSTSVLILKKFRIHIYIFLFLLGSILMCISILLITIYKEKSESLDFNSFFLLFLTGTTSFFAHYFLLKTLKRSNTYIIEILLNFTIFLAFFYGYYFFDESINFLGLIGSLIIIGVNLYRNVIHQP